MNTARKYPERPDKPEEQYSEWDDEFQCYGVFGESGHCYAQFSSHEEAVEFIDKGPELEEASYETPLNPGIERTVGWLREKLFNTCDSGDGVTADFDCDRGYPYVVILVKPCNMVQDTKKLVRLLKAKGVDIKAIGEFPCIQSSYDPVNEVAMIDLMGVDDGLLFKNSKKQMEKE